MKHPTLSFLFSLAFLALCVGAARGGRGRSTSISSQGKINHRSTIRKENPATRLSTGRNDSQYNSKNRTPYLLGPNKNIKDKIVDKPKALSYLLGGNQDSRVRQNPKNTKIKISLALRSFFSNKERVNREEQKSKRCKRDGNCKDSRERPEIKRDKPKNIKSKISPALSSFLGGYKDPREGPEIKSENSKSTKSTISPVWKSFLGGQPSDGQKNEIEKKRKVRKDKINMIHGTTSNLPQVLLKNKTPNTKNTDLSKALRSFLESKKDSVTPKLKSSDSGKRPDLKSKGPKNTDSKIGADLIRSFLNGKHKAGPEPMKISLKSFLSNKKSEKSGTQNKPKTKTICKRAIDSKCQPSDGQKNEIEKKHKVRKDKIDMIHGYGINPTKQILKETDIEGKYKKRLNVIQGTKNKDSKKLQRDALAKKLLTDKHTLAKTYNANISPIWDQTVEFSQDKANFKFKDQEEFKHAGKTIKEVAEAKDFDTNEFLMHVYHHPTKTNTLVSDNNRGLAAHVIGEHNIGSYQVIDPTQAANKKAFENNKNGGQWVAFDKNKDEKFPDTKNKTIQKIKITRTIN